MKGMIVGVVCVLFAVALMVPAIAKSKCEEPVYITNEEKLYRFQRPDKAWKEKETGKLNDYWFVKSDHSAVFIGSRIYTVPLEEFDLSVTQHEWIKIMQKKYKLKNLKIIDEDHITIDEHPAFWSVVEMKIRGSAWKEKIYLVQGGKFYYRLRFACPKKYFDKHLEGFERLVESFEILEETPDEETTDESKGN